MKVMVSLWSTGLHTDRPPSERLTSSLRTMENNGVKVGVLQPVDDIAYAGLVALLFAQICRETGKEHMVKVHSGEGLANHSGPEPCGGLREETDEKSVGGHVGEVLRRETC
jgi:hypothetical protein